MLMAISDFDAVLLDVSEPTSGGVDSFDLIHEAQPQLPVLACAGQSEAALILSLMERGAADVIDRDAVEPAGLVERVRLAVMRSRATNAAQQFQEDASVNALTYAIGQDLNALLVAMIRDLQSVEPMLVDQPQYLSLLRSASNTAMRGTDLTHRMQVLARPPTDGQPSAGHVLWEMMPSLEHLVGPTIVLKTEIDRSSWPSLFDSTQLRALANTLVGNAVTAMLGVGVIELHCNNRSLDHGQALDGELLPAGDYVVLECHDSRYEQATSLRRRMMAKDASDDAPQPEPPGLALVTRLLERQGGRLIQRYIDNVGCRFVAALPRATSDRWRTRSPAARSNRQRRVLIAEPDTFLRDTLVSYVDALGYLVVETPALEQLMDQPLNDKPLDAVISSAPALSDRAARQALTRCASTQPGLRMLAILDTSAQAFEPPSGLSIAHTLCRPFDLLKLARHLHLLWAATEASTDH